MASSARAGRGAIEASRRLLGRGWQGTHGISRVRNASLLGGELLRPRRAVGSGIGTLQRIAGGTSIATTTVNVAEQQVWPMGKAPLSAGTCHRRGGGGEEGGEGEIAGAMEAERCWASGITRRSGSHAVLGGGAAGAIATPVPIARVAMAVEPPNLIGGGEQWRGFLFPPRTAVCRDLDLSSSSGLGKLSSSAGCRDEETAAPLARLAGEGFGGNGWVGGWNVRATRGISSGRRLLYERSLSAGISIPMGMSTADLESARSVVRTDRDPDFGQQRNQLIIATGCPGAGAGGGGVGGGDGLPVAAPAAGSSPVAAGAASSMAAAVSMPRETSGSGSVSNMGARSGAGSLVEISAKIFGNVIGNGLRSGHKILRQQLLGEKITSWYPNPIQKTDPRFEAIEEKRRLLKLERLRRRGKGAPKKGQGKRAAKRGSK